MSPTGRHVTAAEALKFGLVDQITDHNAVNVAVKFAQRVAGEMWMKGKKEANGTHWLIILSLFTGLKIDSVEAGKKFHLEQLF